MLRNNKQYCCAKHTDQSSSQGIERVMHTDRDGWPVVSWGSNYDGTPIPPPPTNPEFADAIAHWNPVISPSGIAFYTGKAIPGWKDNLLIGDSPHRPSSASRSTERRSQAKSAFRWERAFVTWCKVPMARFMCSPTRPMGNSQVHSRP